VAGFVPSRDFTDGRFNSVTRSYGLSALFCHEFSKTDSLSSLYEIAIAAGFVPS